MSEGKPFSIGAWRPGEFKDDSINPDRLKDMGFESSDGIAFVRGSMEYNLQTGEVSYGGKSIIDNLHAASQLAGLFYQITGQKIG